MQNWQHEDIRRRATRLREMGYILAPTSRGYTVHHEERWIHGAGIMPNAEGPKGLAAAAQSRENLKQCVIIAERDAAERNIPYPTVTAPPAATGQVLPATRDELLDPQWNKANRVHDWRNHVGDATRAIWETLTLPQREAIAKDADARASAEDWD